MSIQRIDITHKRTHCWQARVPRGDGSGKRLTKSCADSKNGGIDGSHGAALIEEGKLWREAKRLRGLDADRP